MVTPLEDRIDEATNGPHDWDLQVWSPDLGQLPDRHFDHSSLVAIRQPWAPTWEKPDTQIRAHRGRDRNERIEARVGHPRLDPAIEGPVDASGASDICLGGRDVDPESLEIVAQRALEAAHPSADVPFHLACRLKPE